MNQRDNHYNSTILDINETDFEWIKKTDRAVKIIQKWGVSRTTGRSWKKLCKVDPEYLIYKKSTLPPDINAKEEATRQLDDFIKPKY